MKTIKPGLVIDCTKAAGWPKDLEVEEVGALFHMGDYWPGDRFKTKIGVLRYTGQTWEML